MLFHSILVLLFFFTGLSYTIPSPPEEGISINFGNIEFAEGEPEIQHELFEEIIEESSQENNSSDDIITQKSIQTLEKDKKEDQEKNEGTIDGTEKKDKKEIDKKAIYNPNKIKGNEEDTPIEEEFGDLNSPHFNEGGFGNGLEEIPSDRQYH